MFLTTSNLVHYLLSRGLLSSSQVVGSRLVIWDASRRNRNFKVLVGDSEGLFVKQVQSTSELSIKTIQREIDCYQLAKEFPKWAELMPAVVDHDPKRRSLVMELFPRAENLREYHSRVNTYPSDVARLLGTLLGQFHGAVAVGDFTQSQYEFFRQKPCWILGFRAAPSDASGAVKRLLEFINGHPLMVQGLDELLANWRFCHVIHGDLKWDNCLVFPNAVGQAEVRIIDWELVDIGDIAWDIAGIIHSYFVSWVSAHRQQQRFTDESTLFQALEASNQFRRAISCFWRAYVDAADVESSEESSELSRCIQYAAARILLTVYELSWRSDQLSDESVWMLHLSEVLMRRPDWFASFFLENAESKT